MYKNQNMKIYALSLGLIMTAVLLALGHAPASAASSNSALKKCQRRVDSLNKFQTNLETYRLARYPKPSEVNEAKYYTLPDGRPTVKYQGSEKDRKGKINYVLYLKRYYVYWNDFIDLDYKDNPSDKTIDLRYSPFENPTVGDPIGDFTRTNEALEKRIIEQRKIIDGAKSELTPPSKNRCDEAGVQASVNTKYAKMKSEKPLSKLSTGLKGVKQAVKASNKPYKKLKSIRKKLDAGQNLEYSKHRHHWFPPIVKE